ncbi:DUF418 domain-containing protein [Aliikangiella sp. IMCC44653]
MQPIQNEQPEITIDNSMHPTESNARITALDFIRGIAIFGILIMNVQSFGNVFASYFNPTVNGDFAGINLATWFITNLFFEQKFYTIFSMLFGAGICLMASNAQTKNQSPAKIHYRRSFWLLVFGFCHGYLIWYGDILATYGIVALFVYFSWQKSVKFLYWMGSSLIAVLALFMLLGYATIPPEEVAKMQLDFIPTQQKIDKVTAAYQAGWGENFAQRAESMQMMLGYMAFGSFRIAGGMMLGMALYKQGILTAKRSRAFYYKLATWGILVGILVVGYGTWLLYQSGFVSVKEVQMKLSLFNYLGSVILAIGYIGLFNVIYLSDGLKGLKMRLQAVGQMAFSNYITQSLVCTFIFYGFGLGLFGQLSRFEMVIVAIALFVAQLFYSKWWLERFYYGPLEWGWRCLTYMAWQKFRR